MGELRKQRRASASNESDAEAENEAGSHELATTVAASLETGAGDGQDLSRNKANFATTKI
jgi:hypothetical protein